MSRCWAATSAEADDRPGTERVVFLAHGLWQRQFGGDPDVAGTDARHPGGWRGGPGARPAPGRGVVDQGLRSGATGRPRLPAPERVDVQGLTERRTLSRASTATGILRAADRTQPRRARCLGGRHHDQRAAWRALGNFYEAECAAPRAEDDNAVVFQRVVSPGSLDAIGVRLTAGRFFTDRDGLREGAGALSRCSGIDMGGQKWKSR